MNNSYFHRLKIWHGSIKRKDLTYLSKLSLGHTNSTAFLVFSPASGARPRECRCRRSLSPSSRFYFAVHLSVSSLRYARCPGFVCGSGECSVRKERLSPTPHALSGATARRTQGSTEVRSAFRVYGGISFPDLFLDPVGFLRR